MMSFLNFSIIYRLVSHFNSISFLVAVGWLLEGLPTIAQPAITSTRIWNKAPHNAFTSLIEYQGNLYCAFREGRSHVNRSAGDDGRIRILESKDGNQWKSVGLLHQKGLDFRDPFLSVTNNGELMVSFAGVQYNHGKTTIYHTYASIFKRGKTTPIYQLDTGLQRDWLWRIRWAGGEAYSFNYLSGFRLMKSVDGKHFDTVKRFSIPHTPSEADFIINDNHVFVALRRNDTDISMLGYGSLDGSIKWEESSLTFYGPNLLQLHDGKILLFAKTLNRLSKQRELGAYQYINNKFVKIVSFPFEGDGGYCGSIERKDSIYVTYYSSHINKQSAVYLAVIPKSNLLKK